MAPSKIPWLTNPDLFLLTEGGVAKVWKCKRTLTSEATLMKRDDFEYVGDVHNHLDLIESLSKWREDDYKELVKYISQRSLLVNSQGLVIAELLLKSSSGPDLQGQKMMINGPLYMWSLHIIALDTYIDQYMVRPIPFRPIQFLDDKKGRPSGSSSSSSSSSSSNRDVPVELSPNERKLSAELEKEKNDDEKKSLKKENAELKKDKEAADKQIMELQGQIETLKRNEHWEKDDAPVITDTSNWVGIEGLSEDPPAFICSMPYSQGTYTVEDNTCNIRASYFYTIYIIDRSGFQRLVQAVVIDPPGLINLKEKGRFDKTKWHSMKGLKDRYVFTYAIKTGWE